jgi:hypothetical protein
MVWEGNGTGRPPMRLQATAYCPALPGGLEKRKGAGLLPDAPRFYWIVRQFGGRLMGEGTMVKVLEQDSAMAQVRDPETSSICYLPSDLLAER